MLVTSIYAKGPDDTVTINAALDEKTSRELAAAFTQATAYPQRSPSRSRKPAPSRADQAEAGARGRMSSSAETRISIPTSRGELPRKIHFPVIKEAKIDTKFWTPTATGPAGTWAHSALCTTTGCTNRPSSPWG